MQLTGSDRNKGDVWIPEAPQHPGVYALDPSRETVYPPSGPATHNVHDSRQFSTREACLAWCDANPDPPFTPHEHSFAPFPRESA